MSKRKDHNVYPPGLNAKKVDKIIAFYDAMKEVDLAEDADHELLHEPTSWLEVPIKLVPEVRKMIDLYKESA